MTATKAQAEKMMALFAGRMDAHGTHGEPQRKGLKWEIKTTARTLREPVTVEIWQKHLEGKRPLGVVAIDENATCHWGSIDFDEYDDIDVVALIRAAERWPLVPCRSKSGGLHFFLFTSEPVPAGDMLATLTAIATGGLRPDLTLLLDLDVVRGLARRRDEGEEMNRLDLETLEFHRRVRDGYLALAAAEPARWVCIDADRPGDEVQVDVRRAVLKRLEV